MAKPRMERTPHTLVTEGVHEHEQTLAPSKPFGVMFATNLGLATWLMGVLLSGFNLEFADALFVIIISGIVGSALPAATAMLGPKTRLPQMEAARYALGSHGKKLPAFLNWVVAVGWDAIVNILSASALIALAQTVGGITLPFWVALAILVAIQLVVGIYGHHIIQDASRYIGVFLAIVFVIIGIIAMHQAPHAQVANTHSTTIAVFSALVLLISYNAGSWSTFTADYTRYLPKSTPSHVSFLIIFTAMFCSFVMMAFFGYMTAPLVTEQTPAGVMHALTNLSGHFAPLVLFAIAFSSIPENAVNDNSSAYSLISAGIKLSRPVSAAIGSVIGYTICVLSSDTFIDTFESFLFLCAHWVAPWCAIVLVHWFMVGKKELKTASGYTAGFVVFAVTTAMTIWLFSSNALYNGVLSDKLNGIDLGPFIGFFASGGVYAAYLKLRRR